LFFARHIFPPTEVFLVTLRPLHGERADHQPRNERDGDGKGGADQPSDPYDDQWTFLPRRTARFEKLHLGLARSQITTLFDEIL
jgi:hypothetical protein